MRILILLASNGWGGAERVGCTVYRMARAAGHELAVEAPPMPGVKAGVLSEIGVELAGDPAESSLFKWARAARERTRRFAPDVIHVHMAWPSFASAVALVAGNHPLVMTFQLLPSGKSWPKDLLVRARSGLVLRGLRLVQPKRVLTSVSGSDLGLLRERFPADRLAAINNAPPLPPDNAAKPPELSWPEGSLRLLSVARICKQKGLDRMARALAAPELLSLPWHWVIVGDGDQRTALEALLRELGLSERVTLAGAQPAHESMPKADLVLAPSRWEGMPLVPMEAILSGVPVVGSDIPSHQELFGQIRDAVLPDDDASWVLPMSRVLGDETARAELRAAQAELRPIIGPERMWREYEALFRELIAS